MESYADQKMCLMMKNQQEYKSKMAVGRHFLASRESVWASDTSKRVFRATCDVCASVDLKR